MPITWDGKLDTGIEVIDSQHRRIVGYTNLSENIVIAMIKYAHEMQENNRRPQAWASRIAGDAAAGNQSPP